MGVPQSMCKKFYVWSTGTGDMGPEILYFDELFQRNWKHLSIKLESPTLLQSILYNIDIYIQLDILTYKAPKKVPKMAIWVSHPNGPVPRYFKILYYTGSAIPCQNPLQNREIG